MTNKEKFLALVSDEKTNIFEEIAYRKKNRYVLRESKRIATKVLLQLELLGWSKRDLANKMEVSARQISKIVRGSENLTLSTIVKLQEVLNIKLLARYDETTLENNMTDVFTIHTQSTPIKSLQLNELGYNKEQIIGNTKITVSQQKEEIYA